MVLLNAGKSARNQAKIVRRTNTCGGDKKAGLPPQVGWFLPSNVNFIRAPQTMPTRCDVNFISNVIRTQRTGYKATLGPQ